MKNTKKYKIIDGTAFEYRTPEAVCTVLNEAMKTRRRIKVFYGDKVTGRDWLESYDTTGTVGRSGGTFKIPLLIKTKKSHGGSALLDNCIVKIKDQATKDILYQHSRYKAPKIEIKPSDLPEYECATYVNGTIFGRHPSLRSAQMLAAKLK